LLKAELRFAQAEQKLKNIPAVVVSVSSSIVLIVFTFCACVARLLVATVIDMTEVACFVICRDYSEFQRRAHVSAVTSVCLNREYLPLPLIGGFS
jgi:hypothetical protein